MKVSSADITSHVNSKANDTLSVPGDASIAQPLKVFPTSPGNPYSILDIVNEVLILHFCFYKFIKSCLTSLQTRSIHRSQLVPGGVRRRDTTLNNIQSPKGTDDEVPLLKNDILNNIDTSQNLQTLYAFSRLSVSDLWAALPNFEVIKLLVDTYFDRVHWFMLVFHQNNFRRKLEMLQQSQQYRQSNMEDSNDVFAFTCVVIAVAVIGLQHLGPSRRQLLRSLNEDADKLQASLIVTLRFVIFDLVALGMLESVQVCVLFGSFYLYHANPRPAWPLLGCALRVAQALGLHRNRDSRGMMKGSYCTSSVPWTEEDKRCWWAFYEIDRFCSMIHGYPLNVSNQDCDLDLLDPGAEDPQSYVGTATLSLRVYKYHASKLSVILTDVLLNLYGPRMNEDEDSSESRAGKIKRLIENVAQLDQRLKEWQSNVPDVLRLDSRTDLSQQSRPLPDAMPEEIGATGPQFTKHILRMQALALKFAYENARIVTHRPLLTFRMPNAPAETESAGRLQTPKESHDPFRASLEICRDAALQTASIGSLLDFREALDTYAIAFVGIHCFTAGVVLCLIASYEPLTANSHNAKIAIRQLLTMQNALKDRSPIAAQSHKVFQQLARLVFSKELDTLVDNSAFDHSQQGPVTSRILYTSFSNPVEDRARGIVSDQQAARVMVTDPEPQGRSESTHLTANYSDPIETVLSAEGTDMESDFNFIESEEFAQTIQEMNQSKLPRPTFD